MFVNVSHLRDHTMLDFLNDKHAKICSCIERGMLICIISMLIIHIHHKAVSLHGPIKNGFTYSSSSKTIVLIS